MDIQMDDCSIVNDTCFLEFKYYNASSAIDQYQNGNSDNPIFDTWFNCTDDGW